MKAMAKKEGTTELAFGLWLSCERTRCCGSLTHSWAYRSPTNLRVVKRWTAKGPRQGPTLIAWRKTPMRGDGLRLAWCKALPLARVLGHLSAKAEAGRVGDLLGSAWDSSTLGRGRGGTGQSRLPVKSGSSGVSGW